MYVICFAPNGQNLFQRNKIAEKLISYAAFDINQSSIAPQLSCIPITLESLSVRACVSFLENKSDNIKYALQMQ